MDFWFGWLCFVIVAVALICGLTYGCTQQQQVYNEQFTLCVQAGGTWMVQNGFSGHCIINRGK